MEGSLSLVLALMLDEASSSFNRDHGRISISGACFDVGRGIIPVQQERTYYKTLHGTCITKALKKPTPRKVGIFDVDTEKGMQLDSWQLLTEKEGE
ncbi:hypothetical protein DY000_02056461 [Brassica cretica]|uniref:Xylanase inhibitor N-terminal domain-containing protein n=1 Tax=Brassica cretica TaxID=69181 RepID=A0ABQ7ADN8_BRACR|nr:hypothetical protein DY000_02056461 [Brassica cretica]